MSLLLLAQMINITANVLWVLVIAWVIASWILVPGHPLREALERVVDPMLAPIRRLLPMTGPIDFSPMVLLVGIAILARVLVALVLSLG